MDANQQVKREVIASYFDHAEAASPFSRSSTGPTTGPKQ